MVSWVEFILDYADARPASFRKMIVTDYIGSVVDLRNLSIASKKLLLMFSYDDYYGLMMTNLANIVLPFGFTSIQLFDSFLSRYEFTLSGSLVLRSFTGDHWVTTDMNLYITTTNAVGLLDQACNELISDMGYDYSNIVMPYVGDYTCGMIENCTSFKSRDNGLVIQFIVTRYTTTIRTILDFDFSFMCNWYFVNETTGIQGIMAWDEESLYTRIGSIRPRVKYQLTFILDEYTNARVAGRTTIEGEERIDSFLTDCRTRLVKYQFRGYEIKGTDKELLMKCEKERQLFKQRTTNNNKVILFLKLSLLDERI